MKTKQTHAPSGQNSARATALLPKASVAAALALLTSVAATHASTDYGPAVWRPACDGKWFTSGYGTKFCVFHDMEGYYLSSVAYLQRCDISASIHYSVNGKADTSSDAPAGEVSQSVREAYYAWHAGCWNQWMYGTEHEGFASNPAWYTDAMYNATIPLHKHLAEVDNFPKDRNHMIGHNEWQNQGWRNWMAGNYPSVNTGCNTHSDPGPYWDWNRVISGMNNDNCVVGAILAHYNALGGAAGPLGAPTCCETPTPDGIGAYNHFVNSASIYWTPATGAQDVRGAIRQHWADLGWEQGPLGYPTTSDSITARGDGYFNHFQGGSIFWSPSTGAQDVRGAIRDHWASLNWELGPLGFPTTSDGHCADYVGYYNHFQGGSIYWSPATGAQDVRGAIRDKWSSQGWETGRLGYPTTSDAPTAGNTGYYNHFQGGSIYWSPATGAHSINAAIREKWASQGWEQGRLGFPTTDEMPTPDGIGSYNHFQGGSIYWSPSTGAHSVNGGILAKWSALGWEQSYLGYPTTDETPTAVGGGAYNHFQRGSIYWSPSTGAHNVQGAIWNKWSSMGYEQSSLGFPTSDEYVIGSSIWRSDFQNGWIIYDGNTYKYSLGPGPNAPTSLTATAGGNGTQVNLAWTDNSANENGFRIERSTDNATFTQIAAVSSNVVSCMDTNVTSGTTYYYRVRATQNSSADTTYDSAYSNTASVTPLASPVLSAIANKTVATGTQLSFSASSTDPNKSVATTTWQTFEGFADNTANETVMFKRPSNSATTSAFLDASTNYTTVTASFPAGHAGTRVLKAGWGFKVGQSNPWIRLNTYNVANVPNPAIDGAQTLRFDIYSTMALKVGLGIRETATTAAFGANGGTTGTIEWAAVTNVVSSAPLASKQIAANTWTTVDINIPFEAQAAFTGNGSIDLAKGVLEHLVLGAVNNAGGAYTVYLDNFAVVANNTLTFSLDAGAPTGASINAKTGKFTWIPVSGQAGTYNITVRVTDQIGQTGFQSFAVTVTDGANVAPVLAAIGNKTVSELAALSFTASATDANVGQTLTYSLDAGAPTGASINATSGAFTWTPTEAQGPGSYPMTVRVTDNGTPSSNAFETITVTVSEVNVAPVLAAIANQTVNGGSSVNLTASATDSDVPANTLAFSLQGTVPSGATINSTSGAFSWTPPGNVASTNTITFRVTDNGSPALYQEKSFTVTVIPTNAAPVLSLNTARIEEPVVTFETFTNATPNEQVMFKKPGNSATTSSFVDTSATNYTTVTTSFPASHASAKVLKVGWTFKTGTTNYWVRLTTANATFVPNPAINASARLKLDVYSTKALKVCLGIRETGTTAENGANGGTTGTIEFVGASGKQANGCPIPTRTVNASNWTTLEFDLPTDPKAAFTGDGILNAGQQVLEHLALVGAGGTGAYTVYLDNFSVVTTAALPAPVTLKANSTMTFTATATDPDPGSGFTYTLVGAPSGASIGATSGAFTWTPTTAATSTITVSVQDNPTNGALAKSDSKSFTATVNSDTLAPQSDSAESFVAGGDTVALTWESVAGTTYRIQAKAMNAAEWTDVGTVTASGSASALSVTNTGDDAQYRVVEAAGTANE